MIVIMKPVSSAEDVARITQLLDSLGLKHNQLESPSRPVIEILGPTDAEECARLVEEPMVEEVTSKSPPLLAQDSSGSVSTREVPLGANATIGGQKIAVIAGPCSVESEATLLETAHAAREAGAVALRGGAFKPRTSPYSFQGLGERGLELLARAREETGLAIVTEVMSCAQVELVAKYADVLQVGSRNMHNYNLLSTVGRQDKPVLLKRGWSATLEELLSSAEYILRGGNPNVVLCERGIRTFETHVRNTLALGIVPVVKQQSPLPIVVDPSHGMGYRDLVVPMCKAAVACGADGLLIEMHPRPDEAWSDGGQTIRPDQLQSLMADLAELAPVCGREI